MEDTFVRDALLTHVETDEPPMGLTSAGLVKAGRRSRRIRAAAGGALVLALVGGSLVTVLALRPPAEPNLPPTGEIDCAIAGTVARPDASPWSSLRTWYATELTCYLKDTVPGLLAPEALISGVRPLEAVRGNDPVFAAAVVTDAAGAGWVTAGVGTADPDAIAPSVRECTNADDCDVRTGPDGEQLLIHRSASPTGLVSYSVRVYTDGTYAFAGASNAVDGDLPSEGAPTRELPPLTVDQLVTITLAAAHLGR